MDDVFEIAFRELVEQRPITKLPPFPAEFVHRIRRFTPDNPELLRWASERRASRQITAERRVAVQDQLLPREDRREVAGEKEFSDELKLQFLRIIENPERRGELLEIALGGNFHTRHADSASAIAQAFVRFTDETFGRYPVAVSILVVRLAYMLAPLVRFKSPEGSVRRFIGRSIPDQRNNPADEQYVVTAMLCNNLLTLDKGMKHMMDVFRCGFTQCRTFYLDPRRPVVEQILRVKT
jgi:hypothetical protein